jgi:hypothetical protein
MESYQLQKSLVIMHGRDSVLYNQSHCELPKPLRYQAWMRDVWATAKSHLQDDGLIRKEGRLEETQMLRVQSDTGKIKL